MESMMCFPPTEEPLRRHCAQLTFHKQANIHFSYSISMFVLKPPLNYPLRRESILCSVLLHSILCGHQVKKKGWILLFTRMKAWGTWMQKRYYPVANMHFPPTPSPAKATSSKARQPLRTVRSFTRTERKSRSIRIRRSMRCGREFTVCGCMGTGR